MSRIEIAELSADLPQDWSAQGMITMTLPSNDPNVKPNVILTKEYLPKKVDLVQYFTRIKDSIQKRGIKDLKISDEKDIAISGMRGKMMVCRWDVSAMAEMLKGQGQNTPPPNIKPGQMVRQIQVTLMKDNLAINMTASFPDDQFNDYYKSFQTFLKTLKVA